MNTFFIGWTLLALFFLLFEMGSPGLFYFLSFAFGALVAGLSSLYIPIITTQLIVFLASTCFALIMLKWWVAKKSRKFHEHARSNIYALQGKKVTVLQPVAPDQPGTVKINGEVWTAKSNKAIAAGQQVVIIDVRGAHVVVQEV